MKMFTLIIPAYNEEKTLLPLYNELLKSKFINYLNIIVVNDGSSDHTKTIMLKNKIPGINLENNIGKSAAIKEALKSINTKFVIIMDSDGQHTLQALENLIENHNEELDVLSGERDDYSTSSFLRRPIKYFLRMLINYISNKKILDFNCGLRIYKTTFLKEIIKLVPNRFGLETISVMYSLEKNLKIKFVKIICKNRQDGKSTLGINDAIETVSLILYIISIFNPLKIFLPISILLFLIGLVFLIHSYYMLGISSVKAILMITSSINFLFFGIILENLSRIRKGERIEN